MLKQLPGLLLQVKLTQAMTAVVKSNFCQEPASEVSHSEAVDQELRKLIGLLRQRLGSCQFGVIFENLRVKNADHCSARAGRNHDYLGVFQSLDNAGCNTPRLIPAASIESRLAAADDRFVKLDLVAELLENPDCADSN